MSSKQEKSAVKILVLLGLLLGISNYLGWIAVHSGTLRGVSTLQGLTGVLGGCVYAYLSFCAAVQLFLPNIAESAENHLLEIAITVPVWVVVDVCGFLAMYVMESRS